MFVLFATKPTQDGCEGFRFNFVGIKGIYRKRSVINRGWTIERGRCMTNIHLGKRSIYIERKPNRSSVRKLHHFAG